jgi:hypothetical protein
MEKVQTCPADYTYRLEIDPPESPALNRNYSAVRAGAGAANPTRNWDVADPRICAGYGGNHHFHLQVIAASNLATAPDSQVFTQIP